MPSTRATSVAAMATPTDVTSASRTPSFSTALPHHCVVKPLGGQVRLLSTLNELMRMTPSGM